MKHWSDWARRLALVMLLAGLLSGCSGLPLTGSPTPATPAAPTQAATSGVTPAAATPGAGTQPAPQGQTPAAEPSPTEELRLEVWVPPLFDPDSATDAGRLLQQRVDQFAGENPGVSVTLRVKSVAGPGGLLGTLSTASAAAPGALPALVLLPRADLESAVVKGLVVPLDDLTTIMEEPDWYDYAQQLARVQDSVFGVPLGGDAQVLVYRPARYPNLPETWEDVLGYGDPLAFAAADPRASLTLALYRSAGGALLDNQGHPDLQEAPLAQVLHLFAEGARSGVFPSWLTQYQTDAQSWQAFLEGRTQWVVNWASRYLTERPPETALIGLPPLGDEPVALAEGWVWALAERSPQEQTLAMRLAEYLSASDFQAALTESAGLLPARPSALAGWRDAAIGSQLGTVLSAAEARPAAELGTALGVPLTDATVQILQGNTEVEQLARDTAAKLGGQ
ncbi:MAG TPA: extracellular solute-binding protein [Chloroflexi bacterium]|nr:extracellular solute-binding protein [Chloroflexota bacterium]